MMSLKSDVGEMVVGHVNENHNPWLALGQVSKMSCHVDRL